MSLTDSWLGTPSGSRRGTGKKKSSGFLGVQVEASPRKGLRAGGRAFPGSPDPSKPKASGCPAFLGHSWPAAAA